jgi:hypothetical protein
MVWVVNAIIVVGEWKVLLLVIIAFQWWRSGERGPMTLCWHPCFRCFLVFSKSSKDRKKRGGLRNGSLTWSSIIITNFGGDLNVGWTC